MSLFCLFVYLTFVTSQTFKKGKHMKTGTLAKKKVPLPTSMTVLEYHKVTSNIAISNLI